MPPPKGKLAGRDVCNVGRNRRNNGLVADMAESMTMKHVDARQPGSEAAAGAGSGVLVAPRCRAPEETREVD